MSNERLWNLNYCKVMTANFSLFFAFYVLTPLLPLYLSEHFGATKDVIGLVLSVLPPSPSSLPATWQHPPCCCSP